MINAIYFLTGFAFGIVSMYLFDKYNEAEIAIEFDIDDWKPEGTK